MLLDVPGTAGDNGGRPDREESSMIMLKDALSRLRCERGLTQ